jgi:hypothetical protein
VYSRGPASSSELHSAEPCCVLVPAALRQVPNIQQLTWLLGAAAAGSGAAGGTEAGRSSGSASFLLAYARLADAWAALQTVDSQVSIDQSLVLFYPTNIELYWMPPTAGQCQLQQGCRLLTAGKDAEMRNVHWASFNRQQSEASWVSSFQLVTAITWAVPADTFA